ncbi:helix-turn-helix transcriptional regulator [Actinoallomurus vinaceus]|uniref:Helix-turn-helix transcriptional regulator n=1 Tax=Actinoallomurus vinaceus TaxID=1080074 RepID=A0ABP8UCB2_9ACTN
MLSTPEFGVHVVDCAERHRHWSAPEVPGTAGIVLPRRGIFRLLSDGREQTVDPTTGYLQTPGEEQRFAHPAGGDVCTYISVREPLWHTIVGAEPASPVHVDGRVELAHRLLLRTEHDAADPVERLVHTLAAASRPSRFPTRPGHADLADRARQAILADAPESADLVRLARALRVSPSHLSRTFHSHVGMTVSRYRNRIRISRVLAHFEEGETDLARLALTVGFADQAHLSRAVRAELGDSPARLRRLFRSFGLSMNRHAKG